MNIFARGLMTKRGEMLLFRHAHGKAVFEQQGGGDCTGGAGADDGDIAGLGHVWSP